MLTLLKKVDQHLLPKHSHLKYGPYIWLAYLSFFFVSLALHHPIENSFLYASLGTSLFLVLYFHAHWATSKQIHWNILGITLIGSSLSLLTPSASVFFVYASAFCCRLGSPQKALACLIAIAIWVAILSSITDLGQFFYVPAILFIFIIGGVAIYQYEVALTQKALVLSQQEVRHLARTSERERIARDLHDLIGHTFSVITLKAELANKLMNKDIDKAKIEISALENISRDALSQIREVVTGYRTSDLNTELAHAKYILESNEIAFNYQFHSIELNEYINKELAIILKELVTNILKHANASKVDVCIQQQNNHVLFQLQDNGIGFTQTEITLTENQTFGLTGITERVNKLHGNVFFESCSGTAITIKIPLQE